jgi:hypothetical protein
VDHYTSKVGKIQDELNKAKAKDRDEVQRKLTENRAKLSQAMDAYAACMHKVDKELQSMDSDTVAVLTPTLMQMIGVVEKHHAEAAQFVRVALEKSTTSTRELSRLQHEQQQRQMQYQHRFTESGTSIGSSASGGAKTATGKASGGPILAVPLDSGGGGGGSGGDTAAAEGFTLTASAPRPTAPTPPASAPVVAPTAAGGASGGNGSGLGAPKAPAANAAAAPAAAALTPSDASILSSSPPPSPPFLVRAKGTFVAQQESDLSFKKNDVILVLSLRPNGWWHGRLNDSYGDIPSNFVDVVTPDAIYRSISTGGRWKTKFAFTAEDNSELSFPVNAELVGLENADASTEAGKRVVESGWLLACLNGSGGPAVSSKAGYVPLAYLEALGAASAPASSPSPNKPTAPGTTAAGAAGAVGMLAASQAPKPFATGVRTGGAAAPIPSAAVSAASLEPKPAQISAGAGGGPVPKAGPASFSAPPAPPARTPATKASPAMPASTGVFPRGIPQPSRPPMQMPMSAATTAVSAATSTVRGGGGGGTEDAGSAMPARPPAPKPTALLTGIQGFNKKALKHADTVEKVAALPGAASAVSGSGSAGAGSGASTTGSRAASGGSLLDEMRSAQLRRTTGKK